MELKSKIGLETMDWLDRIEEFNNEFNEFLYCQECGHLIQYHDENGCQLCGCEGDEESYEEE